MPVNENTNTRGLNADLARTRSAYSKGDTPTVISSSEALSRKRSRRQKAMKSRVENLGTGYGLWTDTIKPVGS